MNRIRAWWHGLNGLVRLRIMALAVLIVLAAGSSVVALLRTETLDSLLLNFGTEMAGAIVTFILFDLLMRRYEKHEETVLEREKLKRDLIAQLGSRVNEVARRAAEELRWHGWLFDGSLEKANLSGADLQGADLSSANLQGAYLGGANLQNTNLRVANMHGTYLLNTNLRGAVMRTANLQGAYLAGADLRGAHFGDAEFDHDTCLPNFDHWIPDTDMTRFTDPTHPNYQGLLP